MCNIKVGLYLENKGNVGVDFSQPEKGNPGVGGTQYLFVCLPYYYNKYFHNIEFVFFANFVDTLPQRHESIKVENLIDAAYKAKDAKCDIFIYRPISDTIGDKFLVELEKNIKILTIAWAHNTPFKQLRKIAKNKFIIRYVNVGQEQYDMLRDHPVIYKSVMIYNGFDVSNFKPNKEIKKDKWVTYIGSLIPSKGFHVLAEMWKDIVNEIPDAKLKVIGSGKVYNRNAKLGKWNVADENYEKIFRPFLMLHGKKMDSVDFLGTLGIEKIKILQRTLVGVPNPTGNTENCPGSAIEFQAAGTAVISGAFWGLLDTVKDNYSGYLVKNKHELKECIIYLLKNQEKAVQIGQNGVDFIDKKFNWKKISKQWNSLFHDILENKKVEILPLTQNYDFEYKRFSERLRILKEKYPILNIIPPYVELRPFHRKILTFLGRKKWEI